MLRRDRDGRIVELGGGVDGGDGLGGVVRR